MYNLTTLQKTLVETNILEEVHVAQSVSSTMDWAKEDAKLGATDKTLYIAQKQYKTRGRFHRAYYTDPGQICMSLLLKPSEIVLPDYTLICAVALVHAIENLTHHKPVIKWVNDIYIGGKKVCGILTEAVVNPDTSRVDTVVIGVGPNFLIPEFPFELKEKAISLFREYPTITREEFITETWNQFMIWKEKDYLSEYKKYSFVLGEKISFVHNGLDLEGVARDLDSKGQLIVELIDGSTLTLSSGEISLKTIGDKVYRV